MILKKGNFVREISPFIGQILVFAFKILKKGSFAGDISTVVGVQIPTGPLLTIQPYFDEISPIWRF